MRKITVYCEVDLLSKKLDDVSYELISKAYELALKAKELQPNSDFTVEAIALADSLDDESVKKAQNAGANRFVFIQSKSLETFSQTIFSQCFVEYYKKSQSEVLIFPATIKGRMVAPRITTILNTGLVADCTELDFILKDDKLKFAPTRPTFGAELMATILSKTNPQCATVRPRVFEADFSKNTKCECFKYEPTLYEENRLKIANAIFDNILDKADFSDTKIVLVAGWGLNDKGNRKYYALLEHLAKLTGAKIAATRKVVDSGLMPQYTQIGQTGSSVNADLYIGFGVSGAIQHIMGMKNSKTILAINTDPNAEIFKYCDYKIVADAKKIIEELVQKFKD